MLVGSLAQPMFLTALSTLTSSSSFPMFLADQSNLRKMTVETKMKLRELWKEKPQQTEWVVWFAWYPVWALTPEGREACTTMDLVWMEKVERTQVEDLPGWLHREIIQ